MKGYLTTILLCGGVILMSVGIFSRNVLSVIIAGCMLGIYNASIQNK